MAVTYDVTPVNPASPIALNTLYDTLQIRLFKVVIAGAYAAVGGTIGETADLVGREIGTTGALFQFAADGEELVVIGDAHALDVDTLAIRIGRILLGAEGAIDGAGVFKTAVGGTTVVTVTAPTTLAGLLA